MDKVAFRDVIGRAAVIIIVRIHPCKLIESYVHVVN